jgi:putative aldouronate transport system permease protein
MLLREILLLGETQGMEAALIQDNYADQELDLLSMFRSIRYATIILAIGPIILVYPFLQRYFVKGVMIGSLKG